LVGITAVKNTGKIEEFCALVNFSPETLFESLFGGTLGGKFFDEVQMGKDSNYFWETMSLEDVEEFEGFLYGIKNS